MLSAASLPYELHCKIAIYCSPATLTRLALVHSAWTAPSESVLYKNVSLKSLRPDKCVKFLNTLLHHPSKALCVRALDANSAPPIAIDVDSLGYEGLDEPCAMLLTALPCMHALVKLVLPRALSVGRAEVQAALRCAALPLRSLVLTIGDPQSISELTATVLPHLQTLMILGLSLRHIDIVVVDDFLKLLAQRCRFFLTEPTGVHVIPHLFAHDTDWDSFLNDVHFACNWSTPPVTVLRITCNVQDIKDLASRVTASFSRAFVDVHSEIKLVLQFITANQKSVVVDYDALWGCVSPLASNLFELNLCVLPGVEWHSLFLYVNIAGLTEISVATRLERDGCSNLHCIRFPSDSYCRDNPLEWALEREYDYDYYDDVYPMGSDSD